MDAKATLIHDGDNGCQIYVQAGKHRGEAFFSSKQIRQTESTAGHVASSGQMLLEFEPNFDRFLVRIAGMFATIDSREFNRWTKATGPGFVRSDLAV